MLFLRRARRAGRRVSVLLTPCLRVSAVFGSSVDESFGEVRQVGGEAARILPVECVPGAGIDNKPRSLDSRREGVLVASWKQGILITPDDKGGRIDSAEIP